MVLLCAVQCTALASCGRHEPLVEIQPSWATWHGDNIEYVFRGYDWDTIEGWKTPSEHAVWNLDIQQAGQYEVILSYGRSARGGGTLQISVGDEAIQCVPPPKSTADVFERISIGTIELEKGAAELKAEALAVYGDELMRLNRILLRHVR